GSRRKVELRIGAPQETAGRWRWWRRFGTIESEPVSTGPGAKTKRRIGPEPGRATARQRGPGGAGRAGKTATAEQGRATTGRKGLVGVRGVRSHRAAGHRRARARQRLRLRRGGGFGRDQRAGAIVSAARGSLLRAVRSL